VNLLALLDSLQTPYCERLGPGLFAEPLNATSNLAFLLAAWLAAAYLARHPGGGHLVRALPWSLAEVGLASSLYHTLRGPLTFVFDALSLLAFITLSVVLVLRWLRLSPAAIAVLAAAFIAAQAAALTLLPRGLLNGSLTYLVTLLILLWLMLRVGRRQRDLLQSMLPVLGLFSLAVFLRTVDNAVCPWLPTGTHFLWHLCAAAAGYSVIRFARQLEASPAPGEPGAVR